MALSKIFGVYQNIIQIYYNKDVKVPNQNLIDKILKTYQSIKQAKKHHIIFKMAVLGPKFSLPFIAFFDLHSIVRAY